MSLSQVLHGVLDCRFDDLWIARDDSDPSGLAHVAEEHILLVSERLAGPLDFNGGEDRNALADHLRRDLNRAPADQIA